MIELDSGKMKYHVEVAKGEKLTKKEREYISKY